MEVRCYYQKYHGSGNTIFKGYIFKLIELTLKMEEKK